jgi:curved DNA-binding protein CbpA
MTELYKLLNVPRTASIAEIKAAYRLLAKELHPDVNNGSVGKTAKFRDVASAYEILSNIESRSKYDRSIGAPEVRTTSNRRYTPPRPNEHTSYSNRASAQAAAESYRRAAGASHASMRFNVDEWNAWHYGDKAVAEALKRRNIYMGAINDKASKKAYKEAEERYKEAYRAAAAEAVAGQEQERLAKEKLAKSREARRRVMKEEKEEGGMCSIS